MSRMAARWLNCVTGVLDAGGVRAASSSARKGECGAMLRVLMGHWICEVAGVLVTGVVWRLRVQGLAAVWGWAEERRLREEMEAYLTLDAGMEWEAAEGRSSAEAAKTLAQRVCRTIAEKSVFGRVSVLLRNAEGRFVCVGSVGMDDLTVAALRAWGERVVAEEQGTPGRTRATRAGVKSFTIPLGEWQDFDREVGAWAMAGNKERRRWRRAILVPIRTRTQRMDGAIVLCADGARNLAFQGKGVSTGTSRLEGVVGPIEALAARVAIAFENEGLSARLLRAEKLAGLGQLAGGVAHALNNPLTAVLGFAELIAESTTDVRVKQDAGTIVTEALKMRDTVQRLTDFWRPVTLVDEPVELQPVLLALAEACREKLEARGVVLELQMTGETPAVRGSVDRLRQVLEHLLNNAAHAIAGARGLEDGEAGHVIRMTLTHDARALHLIVSDTGPGFREPHRAFDPFYTTRQSGEGSAGLGLSICYGIVREHGGEISAVNLHPHGAAVLIELPLRRVVRGDGVEAGVVKRESGVGR